MNEKILEIDRLGFSFWSCTGTKIATNPRVTVKLKNNICPHSLQKAMENTQKRYEFLQIKVVIRKSQLCYVHNPNVFEIKNDPNNVAHILGKGTQDFPWLLSFYEKELFFSFNHGLVDGQGAHEMIKTLLYYYFTELGVSVTGDHNIKTLLDDADLIAQETEMVLEKVNKIDNKPFKTKKMPKADIIQAKNLSNNRAKLLKITMNATELGIALKHYNTTPFPFIAPLLAISMKDYFANPSPLIKCQQPYDTKRIIGSKSLRNGALSMDVCYDSTKMDKMSFENVVTSIRSMIDLKMDYDNMVEEMKRTYTNNGVLMKIKPIKLSSLVTNLFVSLCYIKDGSFVLSNVGKICMPKEFESLVEEFYGSVLPSLFPIMIEMTSLGNSTFMSITQTIDNTDYLEKFISLLGQYNISAKLEDCGDFIPDVFQKTW